MSTSPEKEAARVEVQGLNKTYGETQALKDITFTVEPGELFGLIGPDGAGKSTLLRILVTVVLPDSGTATLDGLDVVADYREVRRHVGYMPGRFSLYQDLTVRENLEFFASVFGTRIEDEYEFIAPIYSQIEGFDDRKAGALSGGMKQKLALCCALVHRPRVLLLDEPTTGVDAVSRAEFWDMLGQLREQGITTLVSTPYMDEAARCDRIALLQEGKLLREADSPQAVAASFAYTLVRVRASASRPQLLAKLRALSEVEQAEVFGEWIHVSGANGDSAKADSAGDRSTTDHSNKGDQAAAFAEFLRKQLNDLEDSAELEVEPVAPTVEDVFMSLMETPDLTAEPSAA